MIKLNRNHIHAGGEPGCQSAGLDSRPRPGCSSAPYGVPRHVVVLRDGVPVRSDYEENDHCCRRFALADG